MNAKKKEINMLKLISKKFKRYINMTTSNLKNQYQKAKEEFKMKKYCYINSIKSIYQNRKSLNLHSSRMKLTT